MNQGTYSVRYERLDVWMPLFQMSVSTVMVKLVGIQCQRLLAPLRPNDASPRSGVYAGSAAQPKRQAGKGRRAPFLSLQVTGYSAYLGRCDTKRLPHQLPRT